MYRYSAAWQNQASRLSIEQARGQCMTFVPRFSRDKQLISTVERLHWARLEPGPTIGGGPMSSPYWPGPVRLHSLYSTCQVESRAWTVLKGISVNGAYYIGTHPLHSYHCTTYTLLSCGFLIDTLHLCMHGLHIKNEHIEVLEWHCTCIYMWSEQHLGAAGRLASLASLLVHDYYNRQLYQSHG